MQQDEQNDIDDGTDKLPDHAIDLTLLFMSDLHVGNTSVHRLEPDRRFWVRYEVDSHLHTYACRSALHWRALMLFALRDGRSVTIHEMDEPGRYRRLFPKTLCRRLMWHARPNGNFPPVARFYDPNGTAVLLLTRSRFLGHGVDVLHNLGDGPPVFQALWVSDILGLRARVGINLVRDETFSPSKPISAYLEAAAITGRIVEEPELSAFPLLGRVPQLPMPEPAPVVRKIFNLRCRENPALEQLRSRSLCEDYGFGH